MPLTRRGLLKGAAGGVLAAAAGRTAYASPKRFFRIGSGSSGGMYYPVAGLIATALSNPHTAEGCAVGAVCGVPGLFAVAQTSNGSIDNIEKLLKGEVESILCQADIARRVAEGEMAGIDKEEGSRLRVLAYLFPEYLHVVVRRASQIRRFADMVGKRVSLGDEGSGTHFDGPLLLAAFGLKADTLEISALSSVVAAAAIRDDEMDAFLQISGVPSTAVSGLADQRLINLLQVNNLVASNVIRQRPTFKTAQIESGIYDHIGVTPTISVGALWVTTDDLPDDLVYEITATLWDRETMHYIAQNNEQLAHQITLAHAVTGVETPPLHPGAAKYYEEVGLI